MVALAQEPQIRGDPDRPSHQKQGRSSRLQERRDLGNEAKRRGGGARDQDVGSWMGLLPGQFLGIPPHHLCSIQTQFHQATLQKAGLGKVALKQDHAHLGQGDGERDAGKASPAAEVEDHLPGSPRVQGQQAQGLLDVAFPGLLPADPGEVPARRFLVEKLQIPLEPAAERGLIGPGVGMVHGAGSVAGPSGSNGSPAGWLLGIGPDAFRDLPLLSAKFKQAHRFDTATPISVASPPCLM